MCTIAILIDVVAGASLVIAANRDELHARPTRAPELLQREPVRVAGGIDELSGGTWLAVRGDGRFAAVTNQRALAVPPPGLRSRGLAVRELAASPDPERYVAALDPAAYASMNLVWNDGRGGVAIAYVRRDDAQPELRSGEDQDGKARAQPDLRSGEDQDGKARAKPELRSGEDQDGKARAQPELRSGEDQDGKARAKPEVERLGRGVHVLCNDRLGAAGFPRAARLRAAIAAAVDAGVGWPALVTPLARALADHTRTALADTPDSHLPPALARELTATCIHSDHYGTRSSTIIAADRDRLLGYLHADGPPCSAPFVDRASLLR